MELNQIMLGLLTGVAILSGCDHRPVADLVLTNGTIYTVDAANTIVEALAIKNGRIMATGSDGEISSYMGEETEVIDLKGRLATPGLIEGHGHFMGMGYSLMSLDLNGTTSYEEVVNLVARAVEKTDPGEWIIGRGWHQDKWDSITGEIKGFPVHQLLSAVSPKNPVVLRHSSGHALLANALAMEMAGIIASTPDPDGGEIIRDPSGNPTGIFNETAMGIIDQIIPEHDEQSDRKAFELAARNCLEHGITSFQDAGENESILRLYKKILEQEGLPVRLYVMLDGGDRELLQQYYDAGPEIGLEDHFLTIRSIKLFSDGALGSRGAWLLEPYTDMPRHIGHAVTEPEYLQEVCRDAIQHGFQVCTHAIGDRANREVLDIYEDTFSSYPEYKDPRFRIEHAQHISEVDIARFGQLGVIPAMQAIHMSSDRPWAIDRLGAERILEGAYVWQKLLRTGARIVNGTDVPVEPVSPIACFYASVTRKTLDGIPDGGFEPDQRMSRLEALRSYTIDAAYGAFEEDIKGSIESGKLADITVFSKDIMSVEEGEILSAEVDMTIVNGKILFNRQ